VVLLLSALKKKGGVRVLLHVSYFQPHAQALLSQVFASLPLVPFLALWMSTVTSLRQSVTVSFFSWTVNVKSNIPATRM